MEKKLFIGLRTEGVEHLAIEGGEATDDFHVTLLYGYFEQQQDDEETNILIESAIEEIRAYIPENIRLDRLGRFEASAGSDGKDVIYARVNPGQLEKVRRLLIKSLKKRGIKVKSTFSVYRPHMSLAYINPDEEYPLEKINASADITKVLYAVSTEEENGETFEIKKSDEDKRLVFGWANISTRANGEVIQDWQNDIVEPEDLEEAVYEYVLNFRYGGEEHQPGLRKKARMVESVVFTDEKLEAMGIPKGTVPLGWWIGFYVDDDEAWEKVKNGTYKMFSVEGKGQRVPTDDLETRMQKSAVQKNAFDEWLEEHLDSSEEEQERMKEILEKPVAKSFSLLAKFNPYHGADGRFTGPGAATSFTYKPGQGKMYDNAIAREKERMKNAGFSSKITGTSYKMPKLENEEAERDRTKALKHVEQYFSTKTPVKEKYDEKMKRYLEETDPEEWKKRAGKDYFSIGHNFVSAKTPTERASEAEQRKQNESRNRALDRAAMKRTKKFEEYKNYESRLYDKYAEKMRQNNRRTPYDFITSEEGKKLDALRAATVVQRKDGSWQIAKTFLSLLGINKNSGKEINQWQTN